MLWNKDPMGAISGMRKLKIDGNDVCVIQGKIHSMKRTKTLNGSSVYSIRIGDDVINNLSINDEIDHYVNPGEDVTLTIDRLGRNYVALSVDDGRNVRGAKFGEVLSKVRKLKYLYVFCFLVSFGFCVYSAGPYFLGLIWIFMAPFYLYSGIAAFFMYRVQKNGERLEKKVNAVLNSQRNLAAT